MSWETIIIAIIEHLVEIIVAGIFVVVVAFLKKRGFLTFILDNEKLLTELATAACMYAQKKFEYLNGELRFEKALGWMIERLDAYNIKVDLNVLEGYIESALKLLKKEFGDKWYELKETESEG